MNIFFKFLAAATVATMTIPAIAADDSSNDYISSNPFETMIRLGRISEKSPVYQMPAGSANGGYISSATTSGDAVIYPLGYAKPNSPGSYFAIVSKETSLLIAGETFEFNATMTVDPSNYTLFDLHRLEPRRCIRKGITTRPSSSLHQKFRTDHSDTRKRRTRKNSHTHKNRIDNPLLGRCLD